jgi:phosphoglycolate phosphatase
MKTLLNKNVTQNILLFDFDGVIADSFEVAFDVQRTLNPTITENEYRAAFEGNINEWQNSNDTKATTELFFEIYRPRMLKEVSLFENIDKVITILASGYKMYIVSSSTSEMIETFLKKNNLRLHFEDVLGNDIHLSKVNKIKKILSCNPLETKYVMITDTSGDIKEARKAGVESIAVTWGFNTKETLGNAKPFTLTETPTELPDDIQEYFSSIQ